MSTTLVLRMSGTCGVIVLPRGGRRAGHVRVLCYSGGRLEENKCRDVHGSAFAGNRAGR
jgi:hypothetical protein